MNHNQPAGIRFIGTKMLMPVNGDEKPGLTGVRVDRLAVTASVLLFFLAWQLLSGQGDKPGMVTQQEAFHQVKPVFRSGSESAWLMSGGGSARESELLAALDPTAVHFPYDDFWISQGPHGSEYGHMAIDIVAGKDTPIKSPLGGRVSGYYIDQYGNTILILENERYRITLMHGEYSVAFGQEIGLGQFIGRESNNGYTTDIYGYSCRGRDCGYHTHLNVFDKKTGQNVNPLDVLAN